MRGTKDEDKLSSPMFPRLHVNDTEKGGPRAPPRNKMALYEQLSIPSQGFGSRSALVTHQPGNNESSLVSSMSSSHAGMAERNVFTQFCNSPAPSQSENSFPPYSAGVEESTKMSSQEQKSMYSADDQSLNSAQPLSSRAKCNSFQSHNSNFKNFSLRKPGDADDTRARSSAQSRSVMRYSSSGHSKDLENQPYWNLSFSMHFKNVSQKQKSEISIIDSRGRESLSNQIAERRKIFNAHQDPAQRTSLLSSKTFADASFSPPGKVISESLKRSHPSSNLDYGRSKVDSLKRMRAINEQSEDFVAMDETTVHQNKPLLEYVGAMGKKNASKVTNETCSKLSHKVDKRSPSHEERKHGSLQVVDVRRHDLSETFEADSLSSLNITPDDVVKVMGEKQFWKARKAIVDQQRTFGVQVFELHRLMKVQKLIAESPDLLLEDSIYLRKALLKSSPVQKAASKHAIKQPAPIAKTRDGSQKPYPTELSHKHAVEKLPLPSVHIETDKELALKSNHESHSQTGAAGPAPIGTNTRPSSWCVPAPGNQWLVPVMSPSEGLVYKPYTAPCHPHTGYMAPVYPNCAPPNLTVGSGDFLNAVYGVPATHQQGIGMVHPTPPYGQTFFPPCGVPIMTSSVSGSAVEQNSCNMSSQMSRKITCCVGNVKASKDSEIQGSTASSLPPRSNALPLFPTEPTSQASDQNAQSNEQQTHVIKVVPHNRRLANESAARIFQSIQEERKQCC